MVSNLQVLWGLYLFDFLQIKDAKRELNDDAIRQELKKHKHKLLEIKELDLSCIPLKSLVEEISYFENLELLDLSNCEIEYAVEALSSLKKLKSINFQNNHLHDLELIATFLNSECLTHIDLSKNSFSAISAIFLQKFDASSKDSPLYINLSGNIWLEDDEVLQNHAIMRNWVLQVGEKFY